MYNNFAAGYKHLNIEINKKKTCFCFRFQVHATVKFGVIKMKPVNISHGGQMGCFKISVFTIQTVEDLIFDV